MAAFVPGCVHGDLMAAGVIPHPDRGDGEAAQAWVGRTEFIYRTRVEVPAAFLEAARAGRCDLVLECVDTVARVDVNGVPVGECASQWVPWRLDVRGPLREGSNEICVAFRAPVTEVERLRGILGERPVNGDWTPYPFLRKSAASFGWDWGPRVPGCGLAGSVYLEAWRGARVEAVRPLVLSCTAEMARLRVVVDAVAEVEGRAAPRLDLRAELEPAGHRFRGHSDTEVMLAAFEEWGVEASVRRFVGMFAFALLDHRERRLTLVRDRLGIKPLYVGRVGDGESILAFASELKPFLHLPGFRNHVDRDALAAYLRFLYVPGPMSIYQGVRKLLPGHMLHVDLASGAEKDVCYWNARAVAERGVSDPVELSDADAESQLESLLKDAVKLRMIGSIASGLSGSGSPDSSARPQRVRSPSRIR